MDRARADVARGQPEGRLPPADLDNGCAVDHSPLENPVGFPHGPQARVRGVLIINRAVRRLAAMKHGSRTRSMVWAHRYF